uniref:Uncharacterized protein n=1 Tax=Setaria digitata TaxID=48799 RepID=A0A915PTP5_9BILA
MYSLLRALQVLQCARAGYLSVGLELNVPLLLYSRWRARRECLSHLTKFYRKDIFKADLKQYKTAIIFGTENLMGDLSMKIMEMKIGSFLITCRFPLPQSEENTLWQLLCTIDNGFDGVWLYEKIRYITEYDIEDVTLRIGCDYSTNRAIISINTTVLTPLRNNPTVINDFGGS